MWHLKALRSQLARLTWTTCRTRQPKRPGKPAQKPTSKSPGVRKRYLLLTFMLPNADGCGTGLQLSAKEVVLGRPDIFQSDIPRVSLSSMGLYALRTNPFRPAGTRLTLAPPEITRKTGECNSVRSFSPASSRPVLLLDHFLLIVLPNPFPAMKRQIKVVNRSGHEIGLFPVSLEQNPPVLVSFWLEQWFCYTKSTAGV